MTARTRGAGARAKAHQPAAAAAAGAQAAAAPPANDTASQAAAAQVDEMGRQQPGTFDRTAFIAAVKRAIDAAAPKNLEEADEFAESGKAGKVKDEVAGLVKGGKQASEKDIKTATTAPPDTSKAKVKPVAPMVHDEPGPPPPDVGAAAAMPPPRPAQETDLSAGPARIDGQMAEAGITDEQIARSNEPDFTASLQARDQAREHSAQAPVAYRAQEQEQLASAQGAAQAAAGAQLEAIRGTRVEALAKVMGQKTGAKSADEAKRAKVANDVQAIYERTKTAVTGILDALDGKVEAAFSEGEGIARKQFEDFVGARMRAYKDDRYGGWGGGVLWAKDKVFGMPDEVNVFYEQGRAAYLAAMDVVIGNVATIVGAELTAARSRIAEGRAEVHTYVSELEPGLREIGKEAESRLESQFDGLSSDVDAKQDELVDSLARKYVESRDALNARIDEMKAANRGLVDKAMDAVVGVVTTILKLKDMLLSVLSKAADVIGDIIADPIGFLGKLVDGVKGGLERFVSRIGTHLENALLDWLFGALGAAGITMPKTLDFAGILDLVLQVLGLTYQSIRARVVNAVGEPIVARMEQTVDVFKTLATEGIAGLWKWIQERVSDLEDLVLGKIKDFVIERVIKGGITWIISLLNPAAAFIKACKAIYDIVMWIVERGSQLMEFVNSVLDSIGAIAKGNIGVVVTKVEDSLAKALPVAISFLASLLGLGGIGEKIRDIVDTVRKPIGKAIDFVVGGAVKGFKKMFGGAVGWAKGKYEKGKAYVKGKVEAGKQWAKAKVLGGDDSPEGKQARLDKAMAAAVAVADRFSGKFVGERALTALFAPIRGRYGLTRLVPVAGAGKWVVEGEVNPTASRPLNIGVGPEAESGESPAAQVDINEPFDIAGESHHIFSGSDGDLRVASEGPKKISDIGQLTALYREYLSLAPDAPAASRRAIVRNMITLIRADPSLLTQLASRAMGDPPNLGDIGPHRAQPQRFRPHGSTPSYAALWELESEHVIPRSYVNALFRAFRLSDVTSSEYKTMTTLLIYKGAADFKTEGAGGDNSVYGALDEAAQEITAEIDRTRQSDKMRAFDLARDTVQRLFEEYAGNAGERTFEAIEREHASPNGASTNGALRGRPPAPSEARVEQAFRTQLADIMKMLRSRLSG